MHPAHDIATALAPASPPEPAPELGGDPVPEARSPETERSRSWPGRICAALCAFAAGIWGSIRAAVVRIIRFVDDWLLDRKHAQYGTAVVRILLGITLLGSALSEVGTRAYTWGPGAAWTGQLQYPTSGFSEMWPFAMIREAAKSETGITLVLLALIVCAALFTVGYRTRLVMIPLFMLWVGFVNINLYVQNQSDNLTRIVFIALAFSALSDRWSLDARRRKRFAGAPGGILLRLWRFQPVLPEWVTTLAHNAAVVVIGVQICFVYAAGGLFKAGGEPWQSGIAVYAPLQTMEFGTWPVLSDLITAWGPAVAVGTIGTVLVQTAFPLMLLRRFTRVIALIVIMGFHAAIGLLMGLPWFSLGMIALDAIFISDRSWLGLERRWRAAWGSAGERRT